MLWCDIIFYVVCFYIVLPPPFSFLLAKTFIAGYADTVLDSAATLLKLLIQEKKTLST